MSTNPNYGYPNHIQGFTLIELMISLVLGILISAAVIQVYIISTRTMTVQQSASEVQDSTIFALQTIEKHVRLANLGNPITSINDKTNHGGVVLTKTNLGNANNTETKYFTNSASSTGLSNTNIASDQLTIQYKNITPNVLHDCEGGAIAAGSADWVVERYFVRSATASADKVQDLALACAAGRVSNDGTIVEAFTDNGEVIVSAIDQFKVLLGVQTDAANLTYVPASTYLELTDKPAITIIKLGVIVRSNTPLITDVNNQKFTVFGTEHTIKPDTARKNYYRRSYESTVLLRNARVMSIVGIAANTVSGS